MNTENTRNETQSSIEPASMFEQTLEQMTAFITVETDLFESITASNVGGDPEIIKQGSAQYSFSSAKLAVEHLDRILRICPKYLQKRIRAQRMSFVFAFGPEMEKVCGQPPALR